MAVDITQVKADIAKLSELWTTAQAQYAARKAALAAQVDDYITAHTTAANSHSVEIDAAKVLKAALVPVVAAVETAAIDANSFLLTQPWYSKAATWVKAHWRWVAYSGGMGLLVAVAKHVI